MALLKPIVGRLAIAALAVAIIVNIAGTAPWVAPAYASAPEDPKPTPKPPAPPTPPPAPAPAPAAPDESKITVYGTKSGSKYHTASCSYLKKSSVPMSLKDAKAKGLTACSRCKP